MIHINLEKKLRTTYMHMHARYDMMEKKIPRLTPLPKNRLRGREYLFIISAHETIRLFCAAALLCTVVREQNPCAGKR